MHDTVSWLVPALGWLAVFLIPMLMRGSPRRMAFAIGPFLLGWAMWYVGPPDPNNSGDWLLRIVGLLYYGCAFLAIAIYYVVLLVVATGSWLRHNAELRKAAAAAQPD